MKNKKEKTNGSCVGGSNQVRGQGGTLGEDGIRREWERKDQERAKAHRERLKRAATLIARYPDFAGMLGLYYGEDTVIDTENGVIFFSPQSKDSVVGAEKMSYDEYISVQIDSLGKYRAAFANCYFNIPMEFIGQVERINANRLCFKRVFVSYMFSDGEIFDGKEDHVWIDRHGVEKFQVGDCLSFGAEVYRYVKTGNGKQIDFGLRNPRGVKQIEKYALPSDEDLMRQEVNRLICETCLLGERCSRVDCMRAPKEMKRLKDDLFHLLKAQAKESN